MLDRIMSEIDKTRYVLDYPPFRARGFDIAGMLIAGSVVKPALSIAGVDPEPFGYPLAALLVLAFAYVVVADPRDPRVADPEDARAA